MVEDQKIKFEIEDREFDGFIFGRFGDDFGNGKLEIKLNRKEVWMDEFGIKSGVCEIKIDN